MTLKGKLKLALVFIIIIEASFITEKFPVFFGDWVCKGYGLCNKEGCFRDTPPTLHYGFRHWIFILMGLVFTIVSIFEIKVKEENKK
jgi:hypothetical protein